MENNIVKENYLEIIKSGEVVRAMEPNVLPMVVEEKNALLPVSVPNVAMTELNKEYSTLAKNKKDSIAIKILKFLIKFFAKTVRFSYVSISNIMILVATAIVIITSVAVVTKNAVNSYYKVEQPDYYTYSVFNMKEE